LLLTTIYFLPSIVRNLDDPSYACPPTTQTSSGTDIQLTFGQPIWLKIDDEEWSQSVKFDRDGDGIGERFQHRYDTSFGLCQLFERPDGTTYVVLRPPKHLLKGQYKVYRGVVATRFATPRGTGIKRIGVRYSDDTSHYP
jgi:hypothetical protein